MSVTFEWDDDKQRANIAKHGITFDDAIIAYMDPFAVTTLDDTHGEERTDLIGAVDRGGIRLLFVVCVEKSGDVVRIISARPVTALERLTYEKGSF